MRELFRPFLKAQVTFNQGLVKFLLIPDTVLAIDFARKLEQLGSGSRVRRLTLGDEVTSEAELREAKADGYIVLDVPKATLGEGTYVFRDPSVKHEEAWRAVIDGVLQPSTWNSEGAAKAGVDVEKRRLAARLNVPA